MIVAEASPKKKRVISAKPSPRARKKPALSVAPPQEPNPVVASLAKPAPPPIMNAASDPLPDLSTKLDGPWVVEFTGHVSGLTEVTVANQTIGRVLALALPLATDNGTTRKSVSGSPDDAFVLREFFRTGRVITADIFDPTRLGTLPSLTGTITPVKPIIPVGAGHTGNRNDTLWRPHRPR